MLPTTQTGDVPFKVIGHTNSVAHHVPIENWQPSWTIAKSINELKKLCTNRTFPCDGMAAKVDFSHNNLIILSSGTKDPVTVLGVKRIRKIVDDILQIQYGQVDLHPTHARKMTCGFSSLYVSVSKNVTFKSIQLGLVKVLQPEIFDKSLRSKKESVTKAEKDFFDLQEKMYDFLPIDEWDKLDRGKNVSELKCHDGVDPQTVKNVFIKYVAAKADHKQKLNHYNELRNIHITQLCGPNVLHPERQ